MKKFRFLFVMVALLLMLTMLTGCFGELKPEEASTNMESMTDVDKTETTQPTDNIVDDTVADGYITSKTAFVNEMSELLDLSLYQDLSESDYTSFKSYSYTLDYENEKEYPLDYKIKLGDGSEFTMPITFSELEKKGWFLQDSSSPDRELDTGLMTYGTIQNTGGKTLSVSAYNPTDKTIAFKECTVIAVRAEQYSTIEPTEKLSGAIDFTVCDSLTNLSNLEDIINKLGNPYLVTCVVHFDDNGQYTYSDIEINYTQKSSAYSSLVFELSGDGNYITNVRYDVNPQ